MSAKEIATTVALPLVLGLIPWFLEQRGVAVPPWIINAGGAVAVIAACYGLFFPLSWVLGKIPALSSTVSTPFTVAVSVSCALGACGLYWSFSTQPNNARGQRTITLSAYQPLYPSPMVLVKDETFEDQDVPLDGYTYDHCTFINVCFRYDGQSYQLLNATLKQGGRVCVTDQRLKNLMDLMNSLKLLGEKNSVTEGATVPSH